MKLASISFKVTPRLPGLRPGDLVTIDLDKPGDALVGWKLSIRGQQVFFISPPGWVRDRAAKRDAKGPVTVFEVPRAEITFCWTGSPDEVETILKGGKYDSELFGWQPTPVAADKPLLAQVPSSQVGDA